MIVILSTILAVLPLLMTLRNLREFRSPPAATGRPKMSVLIPARNEEANIAEACAAVFDNQNVEIELIVLDDGSCDRTAAILDTIQDERLRVAKAPALPLGWCGKQHACHLLSQLARYDLLVFVDADVRLAPDALSRMAGFMQESRADLASGVPRQVVISWSERLLLPLIHFMLLGYLPMALMRQRLDARFGAGCGQLFIARRDSYRAVGGHAAIRASIHDGLALPRAFRKAGYMSLLFDATRFSHCRMYSNVAQVWEGLTKNATEGMATRVGLPIWSVILGGGQILPIILLVASPAPMLALGAASGILTRLILALRFRQPILSALLHPLGVAAFLVVQWFSLLRAVLGGSATWRGRVYPAR